MSIADVPDATPRLSIHRCTVEDAPFFLELLNSPLWLQNIGDRGVYNLSDARRYIRTKILPAYKHPGLGNWLVRLKDGTPIGCVGVYDRPGLDLPDFGFAFLEAYHGRGYALEAARTGIAHAIRSGFTELLAITLPSNEPSIRLLKKLGFAEEEIIHIPKDPAPLLKLRWIISEDKTSG
ncbi:GNAT family N-acetyltransferase [Lewinella sp. W8]|nr:GNAT family N-acetyltransferase [Lewinella sp. W8]MTB50171.1 GNAT family N-acetyltransferase [Lewinella sp. W8]